MQKHLSVTAKYLTARAD